MLVFLSALVLLFKLSSRACDALVMNIGERILLNLHKEIETMYSNDGTSWWSSYSV